MLLWVGLWVDLLVKRSADVWVERLVDVMDETKVVMLDMMSVDL